MAKKLNLKIENKHYECVTASGTETGLGTSTVRLKTPISESQVEMFILESLGFDECILGYTACRDLNISFEPEVNIDENDQPMITPRCLTVSISDVSSNKNDHVFVNELVDLDNRIVEILKTTKALEKKTGMLLIDEMHRIQLLDPSKINSARPYRKDQNTREQIQKEIRKLLDDDKIIESDTPFLSPVVLVAKSDGSRRFCIDYRALNMNTIRQQYPIPHIQDMFNLLKKARVFTKLDLESAYHQVRIHPDDQAKTGFITQDGIYEWKVMPFGLKNAPFTFQRIINKVLKDAINIFVLVYLDDICIFAENEDENLRYVQWVLTRLREVGLKINVKKCQFLKSTVQFLGFQVGNGKISLTDDQLAETTKLQSPKNRKELASLLGFLGYVRNFIPNFSNRLDPLYKMLRKGSSFAMTDEMHEIIKEVKNDMIKYRTLELPDLEKTFVIYTDASSFGMGAALCQEKEDGGLIVVQWASKRFLPREINYTVTEKECLSIIWALEKFRYFLHKQVIIRNDHQALNWLLGQKEPRGRIARWIMKLSNFDYRFEYIKGKLNNLADALSRGVIENIQIMKIQAKTIKELSDTEKQEIMFHAHSMTGHSGREPMRAYIKRNIDWRNMRHDIEGFISKCEICRNYKKGKENFQKYRSEITGPFDKVGIDLIGPLPRDDESGNRYIIAATDYATRWAEACAIKSKKKEEIGKFIYERIFLRHGPPKELISDQGLEFLNDIVRKMCQRSKTKHSSVSAYNPQCNGVVERFNRTFINKLAKMVSADPSKWADYVNVSLYCYNVSEIERLKASPFKLLYGRDPYDYTLEKLSNEHHKTKSLAEINLIRKELMENVINKRLSEIEKLPTGNSPDDLQVGQLVRKRKSPLEKGNKLDPLWTDPFWITKKVGRGCYWIQGLSGNTMKVNRRDLDPIDDLDQSELSFEEGVVLPIMNDV
ncbi:LTR retrotransposon [Pseudoloma neurophilia]|uniref:LTR retrotransposon n=1 Tax=Pseudoloma neurophilia TaxID=146866 RepID=A0A0R0LVS4_9MICR|nr:LTR retrotransposon [Pseudoloma neurophilia]